MVYCYMFLYKRMDNNLVLPTVENHKLITAKKRKINSEITCNIQYHIITNSQIKKTAKGCCVF